jgi:hypothetical protein
VRGAISDGRPYRDNYFEGSRCFRMPVDFTAIAAFIVNLEKHS